MVTRPWPSGTSWEALANRIRAAVVRYRQARGTGAPAFLRGFETEGYRRLGETFALGAWFFDPAGLFGPCMTKDAGPMRTYVVRLEIVGDRVRVKHAGVVRVNPALEQ